MIPVSLCLVPSPQHCEDLYLPSHTLGLFPCLIKPSQARPTHTVAGLLPTAGAGRRGITSPPLTDSSGSYETPTSASLVGEREAHGHLDLVAKNVI